MSTVTVTQKLTDQHLESIAKQFLSSGISVMVSEPDGVGEKIGSVFYMTSPSEVQRPLQDRDMVVFVVRVSPLGGNYTRENLKAFKETSSAQFVFTNFYGKWFLTKPRS